MLLLLVDKTTGETIFFSGYYHWGNTLVVTTTGETSLVVTTTGEATSLVVTTTGEITSLVVTTTGVEKGYLTLY